MFTHSFQENHQKFSRYFNKIKENTSHFKAVIGFLLFRHSWIKTADYIIESLQHLQPVMDLFLFHSCLEATIAYINSRDFYETSRHAYQGNTKLLQRYQRYQTRSYFFNEIRITSETTLFKNFNKKLQALLDKTIEEIKRLKAKKSSQSKFAMFGEIVTASFAFIKHAFQPNPYKVLLLTANYTIALAATPEQCTYVGHSAMPYQHYPYGMINCTRYAMSSTLYASIQNDYHIVGNVPLECAEFVMIGEMHRTSRQQQLLIKHLPHLSRKGDLLLLESHESLARVPCEVKNERSQNVTLTNSLVCVGWDDTSRIKKVNQEIANIGKKYSELLAKKFAKNPQKILNELKELRQYEEASRFHFSLLKENEFADLEKIIKRPKEQIYNALKNTLGYRLSPILNFDLKKGAQPIYKAYCRMFGKRVIHAFEKEIIFATSEVEDTVISSNRRMISTLKLLKCNKTQPQCPRKLLQTGRGHLFDAPVEVTDITGEKRTYFAGVDNSNFLLFNLMVKRNSSSSTIELRDFLDGQAHVILYPKLL